MTSWIRRAIRKSRRFFFLVPDDPVQVQIEVTNRCNFDCVMCQRKDLGVVFRDMPLDMFRRVVDGLPDGSGVVCLTGWGEPLMHPDLPEMIRYARSRDRVTTVTTNGVLLKGPLAERILSSGLSAITFSIDSLREAEGTLLHWEPDAVVRNVGAFVRQVEERGLPIETGINATLHKGRADDVFEVIRYAARTGIDQVSILRLDLRFQTALERYSWPEEQSILRRAHRLGDEVGVRVQTLLSYHGKGGRYLTLLNRRCPKPYDYVYVNWKGEITPCCSLPTMGLHNILEERIQEVWRGEKFSRFRRNQREICGQCDVLYYRYLPANGTNGTGGGNGAGAG